METTIASHVPTHDQRRMRARFATVVALIFALAMALMSPGAAHAVTSAPAAPESGHGLLVSELPDGGLQVTVDNEAFAVHVDESTDTATVTMPDGTETVVDLGGFATATSETTLRHLGQDDVVATSSAGGFSCNFLMWVVQLIHGGAWGVVVAVVMATGPTGAAVGAIMYALGANGFLYWVGTQCPS